jgi:hypothetical protein
LQNPISKKSKIRIAVERYALFVVFSLFMGAMSAFKGEPDNLIALKAIVAPFFLLANGAIPTFFKVPIIEPKFTAKAIEYHLLIGAVFAGFMTIFGWHSEKPLSEITNDLLIFFFTMSSTQMFVLWFRIRALQKQSEAT